MTDSSSVQRAAYLQCRAFVDELLRSGVRHFCLAPGSRSTPLALTIARHRDIRLWVHIDERSAAFFGLGIAKMLREPVVLLCTSGTAAANFLPAVVEAFYSNVPLIVLTADRPHELRDFGASQTIDQVRLYGSHVKWFVDLPEPEESDGLARYVRAIGARGRRDRAGLAGWTGPPELALPRAPGAHCRLRARRRRTSGRTIVPIRRLPRGLQLLGPR